MPWFYYVVRSIIRTLFRLRTKRQVKGGDNVPSDGSLLFVSNHLSLADPPLLSVSLNRITMFMAKKELFRLKIIGYFIGGLGSFPVHRGRLDRDAARQAERVLACGQALVMFPEGKRSKNAKLQSAPSGAARIASRHNVPIVPIGIAGTEKIKWLWLLQRPRITVNIGRPFNLPPVSGRLTKVELAKRTDVIMEHIAELLPPEYRGNYTGRAT